MEGPARRYKARAGRTSATETAGRNLCTMETLYTIPFDVDGEPVPVPVLLGFEPAPEVVEPVGAVDDGVDVPKKVAHSDRYCTVTPWPSAEIPVVSEPLP